MPFIATALSSGSQYTLQATLATGSCACTVISIKNTGSMSAEILTDPNGARSIPNGAVRMIFLVDAPAATTGVFKVIQSGQTLADLLIGGSAPVDLQVVFTVS